MKAVLSANFIFQMWPSLPKVVRKPVRIRQGFKKVGQGVSVVGLSGGPGVSISSGEPSNLNEKGLVNGFPTIVKIS
jgi:hypothetical protein